ncbi:MAG: ABC transporter permease [Chloroflexi bacterium]|nr:ABC transporter permease [Chloroflexota bacterium]MDA1002738.1 ABC transporter permease [Chloroflexota bacterium]
MQQYIGRRLLLAVPTILAVIFFTFMMVRLVPGDAVDVILSEQPYATEAQKTALRKQLGLDKPIPTQFVVYLGNVLRGDLGDSPWTKRSVVSELKSRLPITLEFGILAIVVGLVMAVPIGIISALKQDTWADYTSRSFAIFAISVPYFFTATVLVIFPVGWIGWAPPLTYASWSEGPIQHLYYFFFPAALLGVSLSGGVMRMTRTMMLEVMRQDYIRTAYAKGLTERAVVYRHAVRNAMIPVITIVGLQLGVAISGTLILETIFNMPGVGRYFIDAIFKRDYPSVQGVVLVLAFVTVMVNLAVDVLYAAIDPRIRYT